MGQRVSKGPELIYMSAEEEIVEFSIRAVAFAFLQIEIV